MEKIFGAKERQDGVVRVSSRSYILFFGYGEENGNGYNYRARFDHKPSVSELREVIETHVNGLTTQRLSVATSGQVNKCGLVMPISVTMQTLISARTFQSRYECTTTLLKERPYQR